MDSYFPCMMQDQKSGSNPDNNGSIMYMSQESVHVPYMELLSANCQVSSPTIRREDDDLLSLIPSSSSSLNLQSDFGHLQITSPLDNPQNFQPQALSLTLGNYGFTSDMTIATLNCSSKYLKPAQDLLDEFVSVWKSMKPTTKKSIIDEIDLKPSSNLPLNDEKLSKLLTMLEELDGRYRQYHHQMQVLASSFETIAGFDSAKPYTALALQTISRQFRCLRDTINNQVRAIQRRMGEDQEEEGAMPLSSQGRLSRLRNLELQIRQQKSIQQFGMMRQSWRPQRGLPESSVSILRAWLFEHFLHPYPKDSEKIMLARHTGLTRGQVANWFINARVRLWKPMVEEMYAEEFREDANSSTILDHAVDANPFDHASSVTTTYDLGELGNPMVENQVSLALGVHGSSSSSGSRMPMEYMGDGGSTDYFPIEEDHHDHINNLKNHGIISSSQMLP